MRIKMHKFFIIWCCFLGSNTILAAQLPSFIKKCHFGDSPCMIDSINQLIKRYPQGIPDIGLPALDVLHLPDTPILNSTSHGPVWLNFHMFNFVNKGFNNATITDIEGFERNPTQKKLVVKARIPRLLHISDYNMSVRWLLFRANTTGKLESDFQNFYLSLYFKVIQEYRNNKRYLKIYDMVPHVGLDRWIIWLDKLYKENTDLTVALNSVFNDNWVEFWNGLEPRILQAFSIAFTDMLDKVFKTVAYDDMFLTV